MANTIWQRLQRQVATIYATSNFDIALMAEAADLGEQQDRKIASLREQIATTIATRNAAQEESTRNVEARREAERERDEAKAQLQSVCNPGECQFVECEMARAADAEQRAATARDDAMIAHRWFAQHFGAVMNGRDFAVKCSMADVAVASRLATARREAIEALTTLRDKVCDVAEYGTLSTAIEAIRSLSPQAQEQPCSRCNWPLREHAIQPTANVILEPRDYVCPQAQAKDDTQQLYDELLFAVVRKWPDETRHQTALRYIRQVEERSTFAPQEQPKEKP